MLTTSIILKSLVFDKEIVCFYTSKANYTNFLTSNLFDVCLASRGGVQHSNLCEFHNNTANNNINNTEAGATAV